jgi:hypothetical protein
MEWGRLFSPAVYRSVFASMYGGDMYWGDDFDNVADRRHHERHGHGTLRAETSP